MVNVVGIGGIFIDDVVLPNGQTHMEQLGGAVVHAMMGAALWIEKPGILAFAGEDLPTVSHDLIKTYLDAHGLITLPQRQARAWQIFEHDGSRRELHRVSNMEAFVHGPQPADIIPAYHKAQAFYLLQDFNGIRRWTDALDGIIVWEPSQLVMTSDNTEAFRAALRTTRPNIVSPNLLEAKKIYGDLSADALIDAMLADGAQGVALRLGEEGSIVADLRERHRIPAVSVPTIVDLTGAGNTYCGGLIAGLTIGKSLHEAALMAAVSASFCLETFGVFTPDAARQVQCTSRLSQIT